MKQIGFIIMVSISGIYAAHHLRMIHHPSHALHQGIRGMIPETKSAMTYHHAIKLKKNSLNAENVNIEIFQDQKQIQESDNTINNQMIDEINMESISFINEDQLQISDRNIQEQFNDRPLIYTDYGGMETGDTEIRETFSQENSVMHTGS